MNHSTIEITNGEMNFAASTATPIKAMRGSSGTTSSKKKRTSKRSHNVFPCSIANCTNKGFRSVQSLKRPWDFIDAYSGRVCDYHYLLDYRMARKLQKPATQTICCAEKCAEKIYKRNQSAIHTGNFSHNNNNNNNNADDGKQLNFKRSFLKKNWNKLCKSHYTEQLNMQNSKQPIANSTTDTATAAAASSASSSDSDSDYVPMSSVVHDIPTTKKHYARRHINHHHHKAKPSSDFSFSETRHSVPQDQSTRDVLESLLALSRSLPKRKQLPNHKRLRSDTNLIDPINPSYKKKSKQQQQHHIIHHHHHHYYHEVPQDIEISHPVNKLSLSLPSSRKTIKKDINPASAVNAQRFMELDFVPSTPTGNSGSTKLSVFLKTADSQH